MKFFSKIIQPALSLILITAPTFALAQALGPFGVSQDAAKDPAKQSIEQIVNFLKEAANLMISWVLAIALIALMITGYIYITSLGNRQAAETAKKSFLYIIVGVGIVVGSYAVLTAVANYLGKSP